jgi:cbb3-type cytochrome c oxidase subunit III
MRIQVMIAVLLAIPALSQAQKNQRRGQEIFQEQCAGCHGPDGHAQTDMGKALEAADLTSEAIQQKSESELSKSVKGGKGKMPAFENKLADDEIKAVLTHVKQLGKKP